MRFLLWGSASAIVSETISAGERTLAEALVTTAIVAGSNTVLSPALAATVGVFERKATATITYWSSQQRSPRHAPVCLRRIGAQAEEEAAGLECCEQQEVSQLSGSLRTRCVRVSVRGSHSIVETDQLMLRYFDWWWWWRRKETWGEKGGPLIGIDIWAMARGENGAIGSISLAGRTSYVCTLE